MQQLYRFVGLDVAMEPRFPTLTSRAEAYRVKDGDTAQAQIRLFLPDGLSDDLSEYMYLCGLFYRALLHFDGMMLHASAVGYGGKAYLFSAPSGTGKSTHTQGWLQALPDAVILNDDKPALRILDGVLYACGTPFSGTSPLNANLILPVGGICVLTRGEGNRIERLRPEEALPLLYSQTTMMLTEAEGRLLLEVLERVVSKAPLYRLACTVGRDAVKCSFEAMTGETLK